MSESTFDSIHFNSVYVLLRFSVDRFCRIKYDLVTPLHEVSNNEEKSK